MQDAYFRITMKSVLNLEDNLMAFIHHLEPTLVVYRMKSGHHGNIGNQSAESTVFVRTTSETKTPLSKTRDRLVSFLKDTATALDVFDGEEYYRLADARHAIRISDVVL